MKKHLLIVSSLAMLLGLGVSFGASKAEPVKADTTSYSIYLEFNNNNWRDSGKKIAAAAINHTEEKHSWGEFVTPGAHYIKYDFSLDFEPEQIVVCLATGDATDVGDWLFDYENSGLFGRINDTDWDKVVWVGEYYENSKCCHSGHYDYETYIKGGDYDEWIETTINVKLDQAHVNVSGELEVFGDITLPKCQFKAYQTSGNEYYGRYKTQESIAANFSGGYTGDERPGEGTMGDNIKCEVAGKYQMYYHFYDKRLWIQMDANDEAAAFAKAFLEKFTCNGSSVTAASDEWGKQKTAFDAMSESARGILHDSPVGDDTDVKKAVKRYDFVINKYGTEAYPDFMGRFPSVVDPAVGVEFGGESNSYIAITIISVSAAIVALGAVILLKKKKSR